MSESQKNYSSNHSSESKRRKTVGLTIKPNLLTKAREMNLNLSKILENTLQTIIEPQNNPISLSEGSLSAEEKVQWSLGWDLIPRPTAYKAAALPG